MSLVGQSASLRVSDCRSVVIPSQCSHWRGNPFPRPRAAGAAPPFLTCCLRRGTFVSSDKSTQKRRLKLRFKTSSARCALPQICLVSLAQSPFPCAVVRQKDCAPTAFRCHCAAAAYCHGSSLYFYRRTGVLPTPTQLTSLELSFRASAHTGAAIRPPRARRRGPPPFYVCLRRGTFVTSDKSTQKRRLKLRFKTSSARYALPRICFMFLA